MSYDELIKPPRGMTYDMVKLQVALDILEGRKGDLMPHEGAAFGRPHELLHIHDIEEEAREFLFALLCKLLPVEQDA